ncbi:small ribosomal subunit protein eS27-like [Ochotona princeps]|uniref:small ribosomal subunit protein eS27-like n=1 Tax=Ochotona princeps TaxID=9978 RepID=UPI0027152EC9|nr:small ribosomal subunit protein eS27-like [Ochotona princeps]
MPLARDLLYPFLEEKEETAGSESKFFMEVKCPGCYKITTVFSYAQMVVLCVGCSTVLCQPMRRKAWPTEGCPFGKKEYK